MKVLLSMGIAMNINERDGSMEFRNIRKAQYLKSLEVLHSLLKDYPQVDLHICDNTAKSLDPDISGALRPGTLVTCMEDNAFGAINKGAGIMTVWINNLELYKKYDYVIWFEPRTLFVSDLFFEEFFANPRTLFTYGNKNTLNPKTVYTGLFSATPVLLEEYLSKTERAHLCRHYISIEDHFGEFLYGRADLLPFFDVHYMPARLNTVVRV